MQRLKFLAATAVSIGLLAAAPAQAQSTATLQGTVTDVQNAVMPGVSVTITNTATGVERVVVTSATGEFVAASLAPGHYKVVSHIDGFAEQTRELDLGVAQTIQMNVKLTVGSLAEN